MAAAFLVSFSSTGKATALDDKEEIKRFVWKNKNTDSDIFATLVAPSLACGL